MFETSLGGFIHHGTARVQPAKLVRGLAAAVERLGVSIFEQTEATSIAKGAVTTNRGVVRAPVIVRATEGFTAGIPGFERLWIADEQRDIDDRAAVRRSLGKRSAGTATSCWATQPMPIATLSVRARAASPWAGAACPTATARAPTYADKRSRQRSTSSMPSWSRLLPQTFGLKIDHAWCGVLGVPRDWCTTVGLDRKSGIGWAGGYVGLGVSTSNLSGRTLRRPRPGPRHAS